MLGFEAEAGVRAVHGAALARQGAIEEVAGVELDAGLVGGHFHGAARGGRVHGSGGLLPGGGVQNPVVVVAAGHLRHALADGVGRGKVEGRTRHRPHFPGRNQARIHHVVAVGGQG